MPIKFVNENYNIKGEIILQVEGDEEGYDDEEMMDLWNQAVHGFPNAFIRDLNNQGGLDFDHNDAEWIREDTTLYVLKDGSYEIEYEEE